MSCQIPEHHDIDTLLNTTENKEWLPTWYLDEMDIQRATIYTGRIGY